MCSMMSLFWHLDIIRRSRFFSVGKELSAILETQVQSLGREDPLEKGMAIQYSGLEKPMDRGAWQGAVHGVAKSQTQISDWHFHFCVSWCELYHLSRSPHTSKGARDSPSVLFTLQTARHQRKDTWFWGTQVTGHPKVLDFKQKCPWQAHRINKGNVEISYCNPQSCFHSPCKNTV